MRLRLLAVFLVLAASAFSAVDLNRTLAELKLEDGRTLKNVTFVSYASSVIMAKWDGGRGTIAYELLPPEVASAAEKMRPKSSVALRPKPAPSVPSAPPVTSPGVSAPTVAASREMFGQVFVTTRGAGAYEFSGARSFAYPTEVYEMAAATQRIRYSPIHPLELQQAVAWQTALADHQPVATATTDADGNYKLSLPPSGEYFIYCDTRRRVGNAEEFNVWVLKATAGRMDLNSGNQWQQPR